MKKIPVVLALLTACLFSFSFVYAQTSISGDALCGSSTTTACNFTHLKSLVKGVMYFIIGLGLPLLVVVIAYRFIMAWFAAAQGQTGAYKEATKKAAQSILGFLILIALFGGVLTVALKYLGATDNVVKLLKLISSSLVETVHAQDVPLLPSPIEDTNLYDFLLKILAMVMRFFIYPALIVIWVATGFSFVLAQGKPEALSKAKKLLIWATVSTFIVVMIQAFLIAAKGTVEQILPGSAKGQTTQQQSQAQSPQSVDIANCESRGGVISPDGSKCESAVDRAGTSGANYCSGKIQGTQCSIVSSAGTQPGICKKDTVVSCFKANEGDYCLTTLSQPGKMTGGNCVFSQSEQQDIQQELAREELVLPANSEGFVYTINGDSLTLVKKPQYVTETKQRHERVWQLFKKVNPDSVSSLIKDIKIYYVKEGTYNCSDPSPCLKNEVKAEIVRVDYPKGYFGLEVNLYHYLLEDGSLDEAKLVSDMIHEGAHIFSFSLSQVASEHSSIESVLTECSTMTRVGWKAKEYICLKKEAYLSKFTDFFYTNSDPIRFYPKVETDDAFVTNYAKAQESEDFAETYRIFILQKKEDVPNDTEAGRKILFFYSYPELVSARAMARSNIGI